MKDKRQPKLLGLPIIIWQLQLVYVALALFIYTVLRYIPSLDSLTSANNIFTFNLAYVLVMIIINVIWRQAVAKMHPKWF